MAVAALRRSASIWRREAVVWRHLYQTSILLNFGQPLMWLLAFGLALGSYVSLGRPGNYLTFVGPGLLAITAMNVVTFDTMFGTWIKAYEWGVYDAVATTPVSPREVVLGTFAWESTRAVMYGGVFMLVMALLGLFHSGWALLLPLVLASVGPLFSAPAMAWAILCKRSFHHLFYYTELVVSPMFFFSGAFFPVDRLPGYLQAVIWVTPLYHVVALARALTYGTLSWGLLVDAAYIVAVTLVLAPIAVRLLNRQLTS
jgi:lipooligosaccharide transport system permease protein